MLLMLDDEHKEHLSFLTDVSVEVVLEFCRISLEFIKKGANPKVYQAAAQKLGVDGNVVQRGVEGLMFLLTESAKLMVNDIDFQDSITSLGFSEELKAELLGFYMKNRKEIRSILGELAMDMPKYSDLEWRFDVQLASRHLRHQADPIVLMKLHTEEEDESKSLVLQTDPINLLHLTRTLEEALVEMKTNHCRRILRNI